MSIKPTVARRFSTVPGVFVYEASVEDLPCPACVVYARWSSIPGVIEILSSHTMEARRRCGLRTVINDTLVTSGDVRSIISRTGTDTGSAFMKAYGYRLGSDSRPWVFTVTKAAVRASERRLC